MLSGQGLAGGLGTGRKDSLQVCLNRCLSVVLQFPGFLGISFVLVSPS